MYHGFTKKANRERWQAWQAEAETMDTYVWIAFIGERIEMMRRSARGVELRTGSIERSEWAYSLQVQARNAQGALAHIMRHC